jgi:hypothetical protein
MAVAILTILLTTSPGYGYRSEYIVTLEGKRKPGSEVCFFGADSTRDPFALYFSYRKAACLPADSVLDFPAGIFHVFARHAEGYVSGSPDYFIGDADAPEAGYHALEVPLERAAWADFGDVLPTLKRGERLGVWIAPTPTAGGVFYPLLDGETTMHVPADRAFVPMAISGAAPVALGETLTLPAGTRRKVRQFSRKPGTTDVVTWLKLDLSRDPGVTMASLAPPDIELVADGQTVEPVLPLVSETISTHTLVLFKDVPRSAGQLRVRGRHWAHFDVDVSPDADVTVIRPPLLLTPAATIRVEWGPEPAPLPTECREPARPASVLVTLLACAPRESGERSCTVADRQSASFRSGRLALEGVSSGQYTVEVTLPRLAKQTFAIDVTPGDAAVQVPLDPFEFFGTVTVNGEPVKAVLRFESGEAQSDSTGRYTATLAAGPGKNLIRADLCQDGRTLTYVPELAPRESSSYDIRLERNPLAVRVVSDRGQPVPGAAVTFSPVSQGADGEVSSYYTSAARTTDDKGRAAFDDAPFARPLVLCAKAEHYERTCTAPLAGKDIAAAEVTVRLSSTAARGRVVGHEGFALLAIVGPDGRITEQVELRSDGQFALKRPPGPAEHAVYASPRLPLTVLPLPAMLAAGAELVLELPKVAARTFTVSVPEVDSRGGFVGVWVSGRYVPLSLLVFHQDARGLDVMVGRSAELLIRDIADVGPISVAFAYEPAVPSDTFVDPFTLPENTGAQRQTVTAPSVVLPVR